MHQKIRPVIVLVFALLLGACSESGIPTIVPTAESPLGQPGATQEAPGPAAQPDAGNEQGQSPPPSADTPPEGQPADAAPTAIPPSPTPSEPLAALVNGQPIFLADYDKELARFEKAQADLGLTDEEGGDEDTFNYRAAVLDALIETQLITQEAAAAGVVVTGEMTDKRLAELIEASGGRENFNAWLEANQWTEVEFREALSTEMLVETMVETITADVPLAVEQVHARYIQVDDLALAESILEQVRAGADFHGLAELHSLDRVTGDIGGDLGFFARDSLLVREVEDAAFELPVGWTSEVIQAERQEGEGTTYYLVQVLEKDPARELEPDYRFNLLQQKFEGWLAGLWETAEIVRFVDTSS